MLRANLRIVLWEKLTAELSDTLFVGTATLLDAAVHRVMSVVQVTDEIVDCLMETQAQTHLDLC